MAFGSALRKAREAKGLSSSEVAAATRMKVQIVDDLEREEFGRIAAVIYGKGFIKLYAEHVGLDPKPLIADYVALTGSDGPRLGAESAEQTRPTVRRVSGGNVAAAASPKRQPTTDQATTPADKPSDEPEPDLFSAPPRPRRAGAPPVRTPPAPAKPTASKSKRVLPAPGLIQNAAKVLSSGAKAIARGWARSVRKAGTWRKAAMQRLESIRFGEAPLRTVAVAIGVAVLILLLLSALSRWLRRPDPDAPYPIAIEMPEPYFE